MMDEIKVELFRCMDQWYGRCKKGKADDRKSAIATVKHGQVNSIVGVFYCCMNL